MPEQALQSLGNGAWRTYAYWSFWVSIAFFTVYPSCNWLTGRRSATLDLYIPAELNVPFIPEFVWLYLSLYVLFLIPPFTLDSARMRTLGIQLVTATIFCGVIFILLPAKLGFERIVPNDPFYGKLFTNLFSVDLPHNMVPSLHVVFSALILLAASDGPRPKLVKAIFMGWLVLICISTVLVHQHHLLDVVTGLFVATMFRHLIGKGGSHA
jgi:membrane-associated phospholipid phosphatase